MFRWRPKPNRMSTGKNTVKQSLVWCTPMKTHLPKCSPWGISSEYSLAHSPMMGLHCCVLTHHLVEGFQPLRGTVPGFSRRSERGWWPVLRAPSECVCRNRVSQRTWFPPVATGRSRVSLFQNSSGGVMARWTSHPAACPVLWFKELGGWQCPCMKQGMLAWGY